MCYLHSDETLQCMNPVTGFCSIKSPIYSANTNEFCITALYMKNAELIGPFCQITQDENYITISRIFI